MARFKVRLNEAADIKKKKEKEDQDRIEFTKSLKDQDPEEQRIYADPPKVDEEKQEGMVDYLLGKKMVVKGPTSDEDYTPPSTDTIDENASLVDNIQGAVNKYKNEEAPKLEKKISGIKPTHGVNPEDGSISDGLRDALMYLGPRLGGLLIGGSEGFKMADKLATGFSKQQSGKEKGFQQTSYQTLDGKPVFLHNNQLVNQAGDALTKDQVRHGGEIQAEAAESRYKRKTKQATKRGALKDFKKYSRDTEDRLLTHQKALAVIKDNPKLSKPFLARALVMASGDKRISTEDVKQFGGNMSYVNLGYAWLAKATKGQTATKEDIAAFKEMFRILELKERASIRDRARVMSAEIGALRDDTEAEEVWAFLSAGKGYGEYGTGELEIKRKDSLPSGRLTPEEMKEIKELEEQERLEGW